MIGMALDVGTPEDRAWMLRGRCRGINPDLFYPEKGDISDEAKAVCAKCLVRPECLEYALRYNQRRGIWGGMSERERRRLRRQRALARRGIASA